MSRRINIEKHKLHNEFFPKVALKTKEGQSPIIPIQLERTPEEWERIRMQAKRNTRNEYNGFVIDL